MEILELKKKLAEICGSVAYKQEAKNGIIHPIANCKGKNLEITSQSMLYLAREIVKIFEEEAKQKENPTIPV